MEVDARRRVELNSPARRGGEVVALVNNARAIETRIFWRQQLREEEESDRAALHSGAHSDAVHDNVKPPGYGLDTYRKEDSL